MKQYDDDAEKYGYEGEMETMKCDELEEYYYYEDRVITPSTHMYRVYHADEVDAAIAELKKKLMPCLNGDCILTCEVVEKYGKENAELKAKLEDVQASAYAESVDAGMRERRLRRLLWHAIALFCARSCEYFSGIMSHCLMGQDDLYRRCEEKKNKYLNAMYKCRAKAEQYM